MYPSSYTSLWPTSSPLLPNPTNIMKTQPNIELKNTLSLNQIEGFIPVKEFIDETNTTWSLVKSSTDSTVDVPDPKGMQIVDFWNHEFPGLKTKLYVYVVEGIRQPRVETEQPSRILYQWFSSVFVPTFNPTMITEREWFKANVYAAGIVNARVSKLNAICHIEGDAMETNEALNKEQDKLLKVDELNERDPKGNQITN